MTVLPSHRPSGSRPIDGRSRSATRARRQEADYVAAQDGIAHYVVLRGHVVIEDEFVVDDRGSFLIMGKTAA